MSDFKNQDAGLIASQTNYPKMPSWPYFPWIIMLTTIFVFVLLWAASLIFYAPLEEAAEWAKTPNPAKAPWYFIGLQELLVYFDPWIAGVVLPGQILVGLALIPYVDTAPHVQGKYNFSERKIQVAFFLFGAFIWFALIFVGQFLRGPSWEIYWPYIDYPIGGDTWVYPGQPLKAVGGKTVDLPLPVGLAGSAIFMAVCIALPALLFKEHTRRLGPIKYLLVWGHVALTFGLLAKILLRLGFDIKYIIVTPWFKI
ncbi:MAG: hypothetical protein ACE5FU_06150 [Nitrospinota bacterium]